MNFNITSRFAIPLIWNDRLHEKEIQKNMCLSVLKKIGIAKKTDTKNRMKTFTHYYFTYKALRRYIFFSTPFRKAEKFGPVFKKIYKRVRIGFFFCPKLVNCVKKGPLINKS